MVETFKILNRNKNSQHFQKPIKQPLATSGDNILTRCLPIKGRNQLYFIDVIKDFESFNHVGSQSSVLKWWQYKIFQAFCAAQMLYNVY
jgi:hypothetical protein